MTPKIEIWALTIVRWSLKPIQTNHLFEYIYLLLLYMLQQFATF